ncbi:MAG: AAA family ATPase [Gammaproteobacteria bacterium CG22_combo_CG10-13_8_21_14_all_40_8]|nr:MAG: AAA family ATPase [Gammaproteobacteria bacterium CG22_combo_CG10-13_8_21_14_all_40_8]
MNTGMKTETLQSTQKLLMRVLKSLSQVVLGKENEIKLSLACLLARGHLLIEDLPGTGKTTLAHALAKTMGLDFQRVQFTSDMLPADILGAAIFERSKEAFRFHQGPIFTQLVLADEVNRATPKTQSALLEAMEERQVTIDGETKKLPEPFFVIATQNPSHQIGTYPLPESQLDRFLMRLSLGYPSLGDERQLLLGQDRRQMISKLHCELPKEQLLLLQNQVDKVKASTTLVNYLLDLVVASRQETRCQHGLSPRASVMCLKAAKAWVLFDARDYVLPEDIQAVFVSVAAHRLNLNEPIEAKSIVEQWIKETPIPI